MFGEHRLHWSLITPHIINIGTMSDQGQGWLMALMTHIYCVDLTVDQSRYLHCTARCILGTDPAAAAAAAGAWTVKYTSNNNNYNKDIMYIEHIHHALLLLMSSKSLPISNQPKNI